MEVNFLLQNSLQKSFKLLPEIKLFDDRFSFTFLNIYTKTTVTDDVKQFGPWITNLKQWENKLQVIIQCLYEACMFLLK